jgi:hypothetical protein
MGMVTDFLFGPRNTGSASEEDVTVFSVDTGSGEVTHGDGGSGCRRVHGGRLCRTTDDLLARHPSIKAGHDRA